MAKHWLPGGQTGLVPPEGGGSRGVNPLCSAWKLVSAVLDAQVDMHMGLLSGCWRLIAMLMHVPHHAGFAASSGIPLG